MNTSEEENLLTVFPATLSSVYPPSPAVGRGWLRSAQMKHATEPAAAADANEKSSMLPPPSLRPLCGCRRLPAAEAPLMLSANLLVTPMQAKRVADVAEPLLPPTRTKRCVAVEDIRPPATLTSSADAFSSVGQIKRLYIRQRRACVRVRHEFRLMSIYIPGYSIAAIRQRMKVFKRRNWLPAARRALLYAVRRRNRTPPELERRLKTRIFG